MSPLLLLLACGSHELPSALYLDTPPQQQVRVIERPTDLASAIRVLVGDDPLLRRPDPGLPGQWAALPGGAPIEAWSGLARRADAGPEEWGALANTWRGTVAVPLARGAALAAVEVLSAVMPPPGDPMGPPAALTVLRWLSPLTGDNRPTPSDIRAPYAWMQSGDPATLRRNILLVAERRVLLGWLEAPTIPLDAVGAALRPGLYDRLLAEPTGALLAARAAGASAPDRAEAGEIALRRATDLTLREVAADRDAEQREIASLLDQESAALGTLGDPVSALLATAREAFTSDASSDRSAGFALVALSAERLVGACAPGLCRDLDRTATISRSEVWHADVAPLARAWQVIALKRATDAFEVTVRLPSFGDSLPDIADALLGTSGGPLPVTAINRNLPTPQLLLELSRAAGGGDELSPEAVTRVLEARLVQTCERALELPQTPVQKEIIERIARRARP